MPSPSTSLATLRPDLAGSFREFDTAMDREGFVANQIYPVMEVAVQAGTFGRIPLEQLLQSRDTLRAPGSGYARGEFTFTEDSFATEENGAEEPVDDRESAMYANYFDAEAVSAERARDAVLRGYEQRVVAQVTDTATLPDGAAGGGAWDLPNAATATPINDVEVAAQAIYDATGMWPNLCVMSTKIGRQVRHTTQIIDRSKAQNYMDVRPAQIGPAELTAIFGMTTIWAGSSKNTASKGLAASLATLWPNDSVLVARVAMRDNDIREPCLGRTFHWGRDGSTIGGTVESYREERVRADIIRVRHDVDEKLLYPEMAYVITGVQT